MRVAQAFPALESINGADCLRLLRQAGAESELRQLIGQLVQNGPLDFILIDARRILKRRRHPSSMRVLELAVLEAAADVLPSSEASEVLDLVLEVLDAGGPEDPPGRWQALPKRLESTWEAAAAVANAAGAAGRFADYLLNSLDSTNIDDELWDRAYARAIGKIEWESVPDPVASAWRRTLQELEPAAKISRSVFIDEIGGGVSELPASGSLAEHAEAINWYLRNGRKIPDELVSTASGLAIEGVGKVRAEAQGRRYSRSLTDPGEILAVLLIEAGRPEMSRPMLELLADSEVAHAARARAFDLLSENKVSLVADKIDEFRRSFQRAVLQPDRFAWDSSRRSELFASAMRFGAVYGILNEYEAFSYVATLAASNDRFFKLEASKSMRAFVKSTKFDWLLPMALQLSFEVFPDVKIVAVQSLAELAKNGGRQANAATDRLSQLLNDGGITVPMAVLRAIKTLKVVPTPLRDQAIAMTSNHLSRRVRQEAAGIAL
ncbi:hypothetical protein [Mycobacterium montefiorense]|nr:hypothetical protein [Mycobacterium montefiorense]